MRVSGELARAVDGLASDVAALLGHRTGLIADAHLHIARLVPARLGVGLHARRRGGRHVRAREYRHHGIGLLAQHAAAAQLGRLAKRGDTAHAAAQRRAARPLAAVDTGIKHGGAAGRSRLDLGG